MKIKTFAVWKEKQMALLPADPAKALLAEGYQLLKKISLLPYIRNRLQAPTKIIMQAAPVDDAEYVYYLDPELKSRIIVFFKTI